jgi:thioredoxin
MSALNLNKEQYEALRQGEKPLLVDFWAPWCGYCRRIGPAYEKIAEQYGEEMVVGKVNIDELPELAEGEKVEVIPTLLLYRGGERLGSIVAPDSKNAIDKFIAESLAK